MMKDVKGIRLPQDYDKCTTGKPMSVFQLATIFAGEKRNVLILFNIFGRKRCVLAAITASIPRIVPAFFFISVPYRHKKPRVLSGRIGKQ